MNDYEFLESMLKASSAYVVGEITSEECSKKMISLLNAYKKQLNTLLEKERSAGYSEGWQCCLDAHGLDE